jgi:carbon monoxide dehydrogenase subunit G
MAITMQDRFIVRAPLDAVWDFLLDPRRVLPCMPGAQLDAVESETSFTGSIQIAFGPFKTSYKGRVDFTNIDPELHSVQMAAEGHERGSGAARGWMISSLREVSGGTEAFVNVTVEGTSRLMSHGLNLGQNLAHELFEQFVSNLRAQLEPALETATAGRTPRPQSSVQVVPLLARAFARRFRGSPAEGTMIRTPKPSARETAIPRFASQRSDSGSSSSSGEE